MKKRSAFSIAEMIITLSIFTIVSAISMNVLYNSNRSAKSIQTQIFVYTEAQALMDQIARSIERNTIDYEMYYAREVQGDATWGNSDYGYYGQSFIDPGTGGPNSDGPYSSVSGYGTYCAGSTDTYPDSGCPLPDYATADTDSGEHPYTGTSTEDWNAFCEDSSSCAEIEHQIFNYLALINGDGDERILFAREKFTTGSSDSYLSKVEMAGTDEDGDGIEETWVCNSRYTCNGTGNIPHAQDLNKETTPEAADGQQDFMPISPSNLTVEEFYVILGPVEDPYRAFAEQNIQTQPQVTIVMTVTLSDDYGGTILGDAPSITFQRTVSTGVYSEVISYE